MFVLIIRANETKKVRIEQSFSKSYILPETLNEMRKIKSKYCTKKKKKKKKKATKNKLSKKAGGQHFSGKISDYLLRHNQGFTYMVL